MKSIHVQRTSVILHPDPRRVLARSFRPMSDQRARRICERVMALSEGEVHVLLEQLRAEFGGRHRNVEGFLRHQFDQIRWYVRTDETISKEREMLLGGYFTHEYSLEAAALFNPSIVPHPDQSNLPPGSLRVILSLRATAEGHISSITFRTGRLDADSSITMDAPSPYTLEPSQVANASYEKHVFERKVQEISPRGEFNRRVFEGLADAFSLKELTISVKRAVMELSSDDMETERVAKKILLLAQSNYEVRFAPTSCLSERVLFPFTSSQRNGIEDARFVLFRDNNGTSVYYATYTAYDGRMILPQFVETADFLHFKFITLAGQAVENKGMALFPRKIGSRYAMLGRQDAENIHVMFSDHLHFWETTQLLLEPRFPWEFIQLGNCGSPMETEAGWLVITHGVGPMRQYCIGAFLLDLDDPTKVLGRIREPLIKPNENEREGYVPNVVYSCGSLLHGQRLVIPYGISDHATTFATVALNEILDAME